MWIIAQYPRPLFAASCMQKLQKVGLKSTFYFMEVFTVGGTGTHCNDHRYSYCTLTHSLPQNFFVHPQMAISILFSPLKI